MVYIPNLNINTGELLKITTPSGEVYYIKIKSMGALDANGETDEFQLNPKTHNFAYKLNWHNCYSFGNGVESNRIKDNFNEPFLTPGVKVSTVFEDYKKENRSNSLIFSGLYNSIGSVNNLNQFIQAEKITKELNPTYGSIQKLYARDSDLIVLCEDKILRVLANKDAVFNADGNPQLTANANVLGQSVPFVGEYGISKNPESFVSEAYRSYFTDKQRGVVLRLSKDGLTPISSHGMKDYFKDNLKNENILLGSYDKKKDEYNVTLPTIGTTVTFNENVKGWPSFKSFVPEHSVGCSGDYYTFKSGKIYKHNVETADRNNFYNQPYGSTVDVLLNDAPSNIKTYNTIDYEGTKGWVVDSIKTDQSEGNINEFVEKEGKYYNYIQGIASDINSDTDFASADIQGAGTLQQTPNTDEDDGSNTGTFIPLTNLTLKLNSINASMQVGDILYYVKAADLTSTTADNVVKYGPINTIDRNLNEVEVVQVNYQSGIFELEINDFIMFAKDKRVNKSSVSGYYASIKLENSSTEKAELFTIASEIQESSK